VTAGARVNNRGKVFGKLVGIAGIILAECKRELDRRLRRARQLSVMPRLAIDSCLPALRAYVKDRLAIPGKTDDQSA